MYVCIHYIYGYKSAVWLRAGRAQVWEQRQLGEHGLCNAARVSLPNALRRARGSALHLVCLQLCQRDCHRNDHQVLPPLFQERRAHVASLGAGRLRRLPRGAGAVHRDGHDGVKVRAPTSSPLPASQEVFGSEQFPYFC